MQGLVPCPRSICRGSVMAARHPRQSHFFKDHPVPKKMGESGGSDGPNPSLGLRAEVAHCMAVR